MNDDCESVNGPTVVAASTVMVMMMISPDSCTCSDTYVLVAIGLCK